MKEIQDFKGLQALRLEGNTVGVEAAQAIAKALETKSEFKVRGLLTLEVFGNSPFQLYSHIHNSFDTLTATPLYKLIYDITCQSKVQHAIIICLKPR